MFDSSTGPLNLKDLGLVLLQFYVLNCLNVMFKVFLKFIFQPHWRYSERGAGLARWRDRFDNTYYKKGPWRDRFYNTHYKKGPWRDRFYNTPKKIL